MYSRDGSLGIGQKPRPGGIGLGMVSPFVKSRSIGFFKVSVSVNLHIVFVFILAKFSRMSSFSSFFFTNVKPHKGFFIELACRLKVTNY